MNRFLFSVLCLGAAAAAGAGVPEGYYDILDGKRQADLKKAVRQAAAAHTVVQYGTSTWEAFESTDTRMVRDRLCWWDMYSNEHVAVSNGHPGMNIEHSVANSWWGGVKNDAYKDLFHLNPSDGTANNRKSNYPLGIVYQEEWTNGVTTIGRPEAGTHGGATKVYEPADCYKGDFARAFFYIFTVYDDMTWSDQPDRNFMYDLSDWSALRPWAVEMLLEWAKNDPVDTKEVARNEAIYAIQHNRNPFIDYPDLAEYIWGELSDSEFYRELQPEYEPAPAPEPVITEPENPYGPSLEGVWERVVADDMITDSDRYVAVSVKDRFGMTPALSTAKARYLLPTADRVEVNADNRIEAANPDLAVLMLEPSGSEWLVKVYDGEGVFRGYLYSNAAKDLTVSEYEASPVTISVLPEETRINFGSSTGDLQYNASSPRFCTYTSTGQQDIFLYRLMENGPSSVGTLPVTDGEAPVYDLMGRRVDPSALTPGMYIRKGRKFVVTR